ncbi:hypothetical protein [Salininema proteolyticum]|uniref:Uncharacterized protein n=1 Tax=Salininema proteolyticum TaxID=1607685 RepID=A0ABV8U578_9ACTN
MTELYIERATYEKGYAAGKGRARGDGRAPVEGGAAAAEPV